MYYFKKFPALTLIALLSVFVISCSDEIPEPYQQFQIKNATSSADYSDMVLFSGSNSSINGEIYEILPGPSVINPAMDPTPFSNNINLTQGSYNFMVSSRSRTQDLKLLTDLETDATDHSASQNETHIILPPLDIDGNMSPVPCTGHGFLHLMFENVSLGSQ